MHHPTDRIIHTTAFVTPVVEHWLEQVIAQWVHHEGSIRRPIAPCANVLTTELHLAPPREEIYIGLTENTFKTDYNGHISSFKNENKRNATTGN